MDKPRKPSAFADLTPDQYPLKIELIRVDTDAILFAAVANGPGVIDIPGYGGQGFEVKVRLTYGNGVVQEVMPSGRSD